MVDSRSRNRAKNASVLLKVGANDQEELESESDEAMQAPTDGQQQVVDLDSVEQQLAKLTSAPSAPPTLFRFKGFQQNYKIPDVAQIVNGSVFEISRYDEDGKMKSVSFYVRAHLIDKFDKVTSFMNDDKNKLIVTGAPGCGKTCFFWMWAGMLMKQNLRVLFLQYQIESSCGIWIMENRTIKQLTFPVLSKDSMWTIVCHILDGQSNKFDVCVCDGVRSKIASCDTLLGEIYPRMTNTEASKIAKLILVTSHQYRVTPAEMIGSGNYAKMAIDSWREDEYEKAAVIANMRTKALLLEDWKYLTRNCIETDSSEENETVKLLEAVKLKYHFAGGCARYMFDEPAETLIETLESKFRRVTEWSVFTNTTMPEKAPEAVISLMQQFNSVKENKSLCTPVSRYVLLQAYEACRSKLTDATAAVAESTGNHSIRGWAFELKQKDLLFAALKANRKWFKIVATALQNDKMTLVPKSEANFNGSHIAENKVKSGSIIWCSDVNQAVFDVAFYLERTLVFLQLTVSAKDKLNFDRMVSLRHALIQKKSEVERVVHLGIVDKTSSALVIAETISSARLNFNVPSDHAATTRSTMLGTFAVEADQSGELYMTRKFLFHPQVKNKVQTNGTTYQVTSPRTPGDSFIPETNKAIVVGSLLTVNRLL